MSKRTALVLVLPALITGTALTAAPAHAQYTPISFTSPVKLTQFAQCGGYEPGIVVDNFGNIVVTAHKQNQCDGVAFDPQNVPPARAMSWVWTSSDGQHFTDMPGIPAGTPSAGVASFDVGDEGDLAKDDNGNIYFVDTKVADNSFTSWHATGLGQLTETFHTAAMGTAQPVDDRPWITAHGNGVVMYAGNTGNSAAYSSPNGNGSGRFTTYMSYNGGSALTTFDNLGITIPSSGWCRPAADHRAGSHVLFLACTDDGTHLFAYVSTDDGHTAAGWHSYPIGANGSGNHWVVASIGPDGTFYAMQLSNGTTSDTLYMYRSLDQGQHWTQWNATPQVGHISAGNAGPTWLDVAPDGSLGIDYYFNAAGETNWHIMAGTSPGWMQPFTMADVSPSMPPGTTTQVSPWGDFLTCAFGADSRLHVVWTDAALGTTLGQQGLNSDIFYSEETPSLQAAVPESPATALVALAGLGGGAALLVSRRLRRPPAVGSGS